MSASTACSAQAASPFPRQQIRSESERQARSPSCRRIALVADDVYTLPPGLPASWAQPHLELFTSKVIPAFR